MRLTDHIVWVMYLAVLGGMVWRFRKTPSDPAEFFLGGRRFGAGPLGLSVMVTAFSAVNYLAFPGEVCQNGLYVIFSLPAFFVAAGLVTRFWMPFFLRKRPLSIYALLEERFDRRVRLLASGIFLCWRFLWMGTSLYASCKIMAAMTGFRFGFLLLLCWGAAVVYSSLGGMRAVVWTDVLQFAVLGGSIAVCAWFACRDGDVVSSLSETGGFQPFYPGDRSYWMLNPDIRMTFWSVFSGSVVAFLTRFGADQMVMQRYLAASSPVNARKSLWVSVFASSGTLAVLMIFGLALRVFLRKQGAEPGEVPPLRAMTMYLGTLPAGVTGLVGAGLLAASMSSIDSGLNSCAAALAADFGRGKCRMAPGMLTVLLAFPVLAASGWILPVLNRQESLFVILNKLVNTAGTPLLAVTVCALFCRKIRSGAVFYGTAAGSVLTIVCSLTVQHLALHWYALLSLLLTAGAIGSGSLVSRLYAKVKRTPVAG